jgi:hypothetical protein
MSNFLWNRKWKILITDKNDKEALNMSDLHCTFEVHKRPAQGGSYAVINIYNLTDETEKKLIQEADRVILEAGYHGTISANPNEGILNNLENEPGDEVSYYGKIFDGKVIYPSRHKENNTDYILTLACIDGDQPLHFNYIAKSVNRGLNQRRIVETACNEGKVKMPITKVSDGLSEQVLPRGKVFFGKPTDYIDNVCRGNNAIYYVEDGAVNVYKLTDVAKDEALVISPETGLIGTPSQTTDGVKFTILLNPSIHIETRIKIANSEINEQTQLPGQAQRPLDDEWIYQCIELTHRGDTRGNTWYTDIVGVSRYGKDSLAAMLMNAQQMPTSS